jgi:hypothetical protein
VFQCIGAEYGGGFAAVHGNGAGVG